MPAWSATSAADSSLSASRTIASTLSSVGPEIPLGSRIVAVANAYDLLYHTRPSGAAPAATDIAAALRRGAGTRFDPTVVNAAIRILC